MALSDTNSGLSLLNPTDQSAAVDSVSNADGTLTISPTTGAVVASRAAITGPIAVAAGASASTITSQTGTGTKFVMDTAPTILTPTFSLTTLADTTFSGEIITLTAGENLVQGDVCYIKSDGKLWKADANAASTMPVAFISNATISANATGVFGVKGLMRMDSGFNFGTVGGYVYTSGTTGAITQTPPAASGDTVQILGIALTQRILWFSPQLVTVLLS